jgi:hypothetical protein
MVSAAIESALNRPIWSALTTGDRRFGEAGPLALRFPPDVAPFAATADDSPEAFAALRELLAEDGRVALVTLDTPKPYPGFEVAREAPIIQMIADGKTPAPAEGLAPTVLGPSDVPEMLRLAEQTNPARLVRARVSWVNISRFGSTARSPPWRASACGSTERSRSARSVSAPSIAGRAMPRFSLPGSSASFVRRARRLSCTRSRTIPPSLFISGLDSRSARRSASRCWRALKLD